MLTYTPENICIALGMDGYGNDWDLAQADESIRLLLLPSFDSEACISFIKNSDQVTVRVVTPQSSIWREYYGSPISRLVVPTNLAIGIISLEEFYTLVELYEAAADAKQTSFVINDGMRVHSFLRFHGRQKAAINKEASEVPPYGTFIYKAIELAWHGTSNPAVRNLLRRLVGDPANMPVQEVPVEKPIVRTVVLGGDVESEAILDALKKHHEQPKQDSDS